METHRIERAEGGAGGARMLWGQSFGLTAVKIGKKGGAMARPPIMTLSDISLTFGGNPLLDGVSLSVEQNDRLALVGRNGSGKSTLLKILAGRVVPDNGVVFQQPGARVVMLDQDPDVSAFETLGDYALSGVDEEDAWRVEMAVEGLGFDPEVASSTASGGERRRAALARTLAQPADLLLLDEPTNHLDIHAIAWLEATLAEGDCPFVLISHDRMFLRRLTRSILWLDRGRARRLNQGFDAFENWRDSVFEEEDRNRAELDKRIKSEGRWAVEGISARRKRNMGRVRRLQDMRAERASEIRRAGRAAMEFATAKPSGKLVAEAQKITKAFENAPIVSDFSIRIARGDRIAFVGPNGVGKTTLINVLCGREPVDAGQVRIGTNLSIAHFDQNRAALDPNTTLWNALTEDPELGAKGSNDQVLVRGRPKHVVAYLKDFLFDEQQARGPISSLSGGEKARLLLARIMAKESNFLVLDEPTNDLDVETLDLLQELLDDYDGTVLLVSHDRDFLDRVATTTIAMEGNGQAVVYAGGWSDYQSQRGKSEPKKQMRKPAVSKPKAVPAVVEKTVEGLTNKERARFEKLPAVIEKLEHEIARLTEFLADPTLFQTNPEKFQKASDGLVERQTKLATAEEEWLDLADRA